MLTPNYNTGTICRQINLSASTRCFLVTLGHMTRLLSQSKSKAQISAQEKRGEQRERKRRERERQALIRVHGWTTCRYCQRFRSFGVLGWRKSRTQGIPTLGKVQECVLGQSEERRRRDSSSFPLIFGSAGVSSVEEWGLEL